MVYTFSLIGDHWGSISRATDVQSTTVIRSLDSYFVSLGARYLSYAGIFTPIVVAKQKALSSILYIFSCSNTYFSKALLGF